MAELAVEYRQIKSLKPYEHNSRVHTPEQMKQLISSIEEFGFTNPILIDEDSQIIAGHARVQAAKRLKMKTVPTITISGLTDTQKRAYVIADNKLAMNADWDFDTLRAEIQRLKAEDFDALLTGFNETELLSFLDPNTVEDPMGEWQQGMPEFEQETVRFRSLLVNFRNKENFEKFMELVDQPYTPQTKYIWYPKEEWERVEHLRHVSEEESNGD